FWRSGSTAAKNRPVGILNDLGLLGSCSRTGRGTGAGRSRRLAGRARGSWRRRGRLRRLSRAATTAQNWTLVAGGHRGCRRGLGLGAYGLPLPQGCPGTVFGCLAHGYVTDGLAGLLRLVNHAVIEGHGLGCGLVGAGVVETAFVENRDGNHA